MILIAGITFLNMGFFLAEASALKLKNTKLLENIARSGFEEERDGSEEIPGDAGEEEVDLMNNHYFIHHSIPFQIALQRKGVRNELFTYPHHLEIFCPPPEA
jgi:hypothetical protein